MKHINYLFIFLFTFTFLNAALLSAQETIPLPQAVGEYELPGQGLFFDFQTEEQGMLVIAAEGIEDKGEHIIITLHDEYGQKIQQIRNDYKGKASAQGIFIVPSAGQYTVAVQLDKVEETRLYYSQGSANEMAALFSSIMINIESSFIPNVFSSFISTDKDGDENPSKAVRLEPGVEVLASVGNEANDPWDWYMVEESFSNITIKVAGVPSGSNSADLILELYIPNTLQSEWLREDSVINGEETLEIGPSDGPVIFRVTPYYHEKHCDESGCYVKNTNDKREPIRYVVKIEFEGEMRAD